MTALPVEVSPSSWTVPPRWATPRTPERPTYGHIIAATSAAMGRPLMPHQRLIADVMLEVQTEAAGDPEPGEWAYDDVTATMQRRGGKTTLISPLVTHRARMVRQARMFMTAQKRDVAVRRWFDVTEDLLSTELRHDVRRKVSVSHEVLRWVSGGSTLTPFAPNEDAMHSETPDLVLVDEVWAFTAEQARAIKAGYVPAFATSSGQALKMSTAGTDRSAWLNQLRRDGRASVAADRRLGVAYFEWSLPDRVDGLLLRQLDDEALIAACIAHHPAICHVPGCRGPVRKQPCPHGFIVRPAAIRSGWTELDDRAEFLRAYGNRSAADIATRWQALEETTWAAQVDESGIPAGARVALGVWIDEDGEDAAISAGFRDGSGVMHVEIPQYAPIGTDVLQPTVRPGVRWVVDAVRRLVAGSAVSTVAISSVGAARDVGDALTAAGVPVLSVSQADVSAACSRHRSELGAGSWVHAVSTQATAAAESAGWEKSGGGHRWSRPGASISALGAQTLAGWGADHAPAPVAPVRKLKIR